MRCITSAGKSLTDPLMTEALTALSRGHGLFAGGATGDHIRDTPTQLQSRGYQLSRVGAPTVRSAQGLHRLADTDRALAQTIAAARAEHARGKTATRALLNAAEADATLAGDTPIGRREAMARMAARLRAQHRHIAASRMRARLLALRLRRVRYAGKPAAGRPAVQSAIRKGLDIKGIRDPAARARWERGMDLVARRESNYN